MATAKTTPGGRKQQSRATPSGHPSWKLEDAKARFSELVRQAREIGPQRVTVRGQDAVVVVSAAEFARLSPVASRTTLAAPFGDSPLSRLPDFEKNLLRERSPVRDAPEF